MTECADDKLTLFETPEGVITTGPRGRQEISVYKSRSDGLVCLKITSRKLRDTRDFYQIISVDTDMAKHLGALLWALSRDENP